MARAGGSRPTNPVPVVGAVFEVEDARVSPSAEGFSRATRGLHGGRSITPHGINGGGRWAVRWAGRYSVPSGG